MTLHSAIVAAINTMSDEHKSDWLEIHKESRIDFSWEYTHRWQREHRLIVSDAIQDWCARQDDARTVLYNCTLSNHRLGVWLSSHVARELLSFVPASELRPLAALEAAERWVIDPSESNCLEVRNAAKASSRYSFHLAERISLSLVTNEKVSADTSFICGAALAAANIGYAASANIGDAAQYAYEAAYIVAMTYLDDSIPFDDDIVSNGALRRELIQLRSVIVGAVPKAIELITPNSRI